MGTFFIYILKSAFCLMLFYLFYRLLLSRDTFHRFNRLALLGIIVVSCAIPFIELSVEKPTDVAQTMISLQLIIDMLDFGNASNGVQVGADINIVSTTQYNWGVYTMLVLYFVGVAFFIVRNAYSYTRLLLLMKASKRDRLEDGTRLYIHQQTYSPFSWMYNIVISKKDLEENGREILIHEKAHINHLHSWDIMLADIFTMLQWFNPAAWLLKQELQTIHEYEADEAVIEQGVDTKKYQLLLIKKAVGTRLYSMANSLNHSSLKKRITMMLKEKSSPWARLKYLYVLPLAAIAVSAFARPEISETMDEISNAKISNLLVSNETDVTKIMQSYVGEKVYSIEQVDKTPVPTHDDAYLNANLKLPATEKEGEVVASFIVNSKGGVTDVKVTKSYSPEVDVAYVKYIEQLPNWIAAQLNGQPVACKIEMPMFIENSQKTPAKKMEKTKADDGDEPYYILSVMPEFSGGKEAMDEYIHKNLRQFPNMSGKVIVQFIVRKDGKLSDIDVKRGVNATLDNEAVRLLKGMPTWIPGRNEGKNVDCMYTMPITFTGGTTKLPANSMEESSSNKPLVIVDGKEVSNNHLETINADRIANISVVKGDSAVALYGAKASNGVVLVTLKDNASSSANAEKSPQVTAIITSTASNKGLSFISKSGSQPLVIVNGKESSMSALKSMTTDNIKSIDIYKSGPMVEKYGEKA